MIIIFKNYLLIILIIINYLKMWKNYIRMIFRWKCCWCTLQSWGDKYLREVSVNIAVLLS